MSRNYGDGMSRYEHLFTPLEVGPLTLKNRIVRSAHGTHLAGESLIAYHEARAKGGVALSTLEATGVHAKPYASTNTANISGRFSDHRHSATSGAGNGTTDAPLPAPTSPEPLPTALRQTVSSASSNPATNHGRCPINQFCASTPSSTGMCAAIGPHSRPTTPKPSTPTTRHRARSPRSDTNDHANTGSNA